MMKSHTCEFTGRDLLQLIGGPLGWAGLFALAMHGGARLQLLPPPRPALDIDRTILIHQAEASRAASDADVLLLGDSSCLMDVSAVSLSQRLGRPVLNLGTLSYLDLDAHALLLREFTRAHPGRRPTVVLLLHPDALWRSGSESRPWTALTNFLGGLDHGEGTGLGSRIACTLGVEIFRGRLLNRILPSPLPGAYGSVYGFSDDLDRHMTRERGSLLDPGRERITARPELRLSPALERSSRAFKAAVPSGAKLLVSITPCPAGAVPASFTRRRAEILRQWSEWLGADAALVELPATLPDAQFARTTHLLPAAVPAYTEQLARAIAPQLSP